MASVKVNGTELFYESFGEGAETIVFSHGYLMDHTMYSEQVKELSKHYRCVCYDHRGHGKSSIPDSGYSMDILVDDAIAFIEALDIGAVHFVGMSTGGFVAIRIAIKRPDLLRSMALLSTSAEGESPKALRKNNLLLNIVHWVGWWPVINQVMKMVFHPHFLSDKKRQEEKHYWRRTFTEQDKRAMYLFGKGIFARDRSLLPELAQVTLPTLIIIGTEDKLTPLFRSKNIAGAISGSQLVEIPNAGHGVTMEKSNEVMKALSHFYQQEN